MKFLDLIGTPLGTMCAVADKHCLYQLYFQDHPPTEFHADRGQSVITEQIREELACYFAGDLYKFHTPCAPQGSVFTRQVWLAVSAIPAGETRSYIEIARAIGRPTTVRAVARAIAANPVLIVVPCHRVIGANGKLTGYSGGLERKQQLLALEEGLPS